MSSSVGTLEAEGGDHGIPQLILLKENGKQLTGSGGPDDSEQYPISNGTVDGDNIPFELTAGFEVLLRSEEDRNLLNGRLEIKSINRIATAKVALKKQP